MSAEELRPIDVDEYPLVSVDDDTLATSESDMTLAPDSASTLPPITHDDHHSVYASSEEIIVPPELFSESTVPQEGPHSEQPQAQEEPTLPPLALDQLPSMLSPFSFLASLAAPGTARTLSLLAAPATRVALEQALLQSNAHLEVPPDSAPLASATASRAYMTVRNQSTAPSAFIMFATRPKFISRSEDPEGGLRFSVYQASRRVAETTGSYTFALPSGAPLYWADLLNETQVVVVTGRKRAVHNEGTQLSITDYTWLATHDIMTRRCVMTLPKADEPRFKSKEEVGRGTDMKTPLEDGAVCIQVANNFDTRHPANPFVGIGGPDPYNPHNIIPLVTWDAKPGTLYIVKPSLNVWRIAQAGDNRKTGELVDPAILGSSAVMATFNIGRPPRDLFYQSSNTFIVGSSDLEAPEEQALKEASLLEAASA